MIARSAHWIQIYAKDHARRAERAAGKWLCHGTPADLHRYQDRLNTLVENGTFLAAKIAVKDPKHDPFPDQPGVICVFTPADEPAKARIAELLRGLGLNPSRWKSESETKEDWSRNGQKWKRFSEMRTGQRTARVSPRIIRRPRRPTSRAERITGPRIAAHPLGHFSMQEQQGPHTCSLRV